jgi:negative regulator of flagellin synthesis FlgM
MNTTISNNGLPQFTQATGSSGNGATSTATTAAGAAGTSPKVDDQLKLTDSARALQEAAHTGDTAMVDSKRVEQVRQALANGSYQINPGNIADRMLAMEQQLGGTGKV